jgi:adenylate cyclase
VRLACGIVLYSYLVTHFANHALGNISLAAMEEGLEYHVITWQSLPGTLLLYSALAIHAALGLWALYERRHFRWRVIEGVQLVAGLSIPLLLAAHVVGQRVALELFGVERGYAQALHLFWVSSPGRGILQVVALAVAWVHGSIGICFWLRLKPFFPRGAPYLLTAAVLLPTLALLGYYQSGRTVAALSALPEWTEAHLSPGQTGTKEQLDRLAEIRDYTLAAWAASIALVFAARGARTLNERRRGLIRITYADGKTIRVPRGLSVLESSWRFNIPHASVCGGRGRCSTCRIRIIGDRAALPPPSPGERAVLERAGFGPDSPVRLACQLRPQADLAIVPLLPPNADMSQARATMRAQGMERHVVSMFVDMRGSTRLAEQRMPYDIVFIINRFVEAVSRAVIEAGGAPNQFLGDGVLALFGVTADAATASRQAIRAAALIARNVDRFNEVFRENLGEPVQFGIGIHGGEVILGDIGYSDHRVFTAIGDAVNVTARLQDQTKILKCEVVLSDDVCRTAGLALDSLQAKEVALRGRQEPMHVRIVFRAAMLEGMVDVADAQAATQAVVA